MTTFLNSPKLQKRGIVLIDLGKSQLQSSVALKITQSPHGRWGCTRELWKSGNGWTLRRQHHA